MILSFHGFIFYPCESVVALALVGAGFGGGVHAVLRDFVDAASGRFRVDAVKMVERAGAFADGETFFDGFGHVRFGEQDGFTHGTPAGELSSNGRCECASRSVRVFTLDVIAAEAQDFRAVIRECRWLYPCGRP